MEYARDGLYSGNVPCVCAMLMAVRQEINEFVSAAYIDLHELSSMLNMKAVLNMY